MISVATCDQCGQPLKNPFYTVAVLHSEYCHHCRSSHDSKRAKVWSFCSPNCLVSIQLCPLCDGICAIPEPGPEIAIECPDCKGRGLELK